MKTIPVAACALVVGVACGHWIGRPAPVDSWSPDDAYPEAELYGLMDELTLFKGACLSGPFKLTVPQHPDRYVEGEPDSQIGTCLGKPAKIHGIHIYGGKAP